MSRRGGAVRGSVRATTGILIVGAAAAAAFLLGSTPLPAVVREPVAVTVDARTGSERTLVCAGSFVELGADPARPSVAVPVGGADVVVAGATGEAFELQRGEPGGTAPRVIRVAAGEPAAASQTQAIRTATLRGLVASSCAEPVNEQWLVGGATRLGETATVSLGNPSAVPATVRLSLYDESGPLDAGETAGVLVPAGAERVVPLNGYAPERERLAVRVMSTGAAVTATLGLGQTSEITPVAVDTVTRQLSPALELVVPGVASVSDHSHGPGDADHDDGIPVLVRLLAPGSQAGTATVRALGPDGTVAELGSLALAPGTVAELTVDGWPDGAEAVSISADVPVVGGVLGSAVSGAARDSAWFAPAPLLPAGQPVAAVTAGGGRLVLVNPGTAPVSVRIEPGGDGAVELTVGAGAAVATQAPAASRITSSGPLAAGVRLSTGGDLAGYPVLPVTERVGAITVYPR